MRISTGQLAQMMMQTLSADAGKTLDLKAGSVVRATLLSAANNSEVWLQIGDTKLRAKLDVNLKPGDQVDLLVTGEQRQGAMELKVIGAPVRGAETAKMQFDVSGLLKALQLPEQEETKVLANEFLARKLPLRPEVLRAASDVLRQLGSQATPAHVNTLGKMAELGIPIHPSSFEAMHTLETGPKLHDLLNGLSQTLRQVVPQAQTVQPQTVQPQTVQPQTMQQADQVQRAGTSPNNSSPAGTTGANGSASATMTTANTPAQPAPAQVASAQSPAPSNTSSAPQGAASPATAGSAAVNLNPSANGATATNQQPAQAAPAQQAVSADVASEIRAGQSNALFPENKIVRPQTTGSEGATARPQPQVSDELTQPLRHLARAVQSLLSETEPRAEHLGEQVKRLGLGFEEQVGQALRRLPHDSDARTVQAALQEAARFDSDTGPALKQALLFTQQAAPQLEAAGLGQLAQDVSTLLRHMAGQQLMQTPGQERAEMFYQFAAVPMQAGGRDQTVELHVMSRRGPGQKKIDPSNCYILFRLDMPHLGELDIHLHIVDKVVGVRFQTEDGDPVTIEPSEQRSLRDALTGVGFHLGVVKSEVKQPPGEGEHHPLLPPMLTQGALDLKL